MANLSIYLFEYCLYFFTNNGMIRKISKTKVWPGRPIYDVLLGYSYCPEKLYGNRLQGVKLIHRNDPLFIIGIQYIRKYFKTSKCQFKRLYFIIPYFISVSDRLFAPSFDYIYFIDFSVEERTVREITMWKRSIKVLWCHKPLWIFKIAAPIQVVLITSNFDNIPVSILYKSIAGRYRPVRVAAGR